MRNWRYSSTHFNLDAGWRRAISFTPQQHYPGGRAPVPMVSPLKLVSIFPFVRHRLYLYLMLLTRDVIEATSNNKVIDSFQF
jgi:hypothetical protein